MHEYVSYICINIVCWIYIMVIIKEYWCCVFSEIMGHTISAFSCCENIDVTTIRDSVIYAHCR